MSQIFNQTGKAARRELYPSDISQRQWDEIDLLLPYDNERGRKREYSLREVVNGINYRWTTGCSWRMLPHDYPPWQTVYAYYRHWQSEGLLGPMRQILISKKLRSRSQHPLPQMPPKTHPDHPEPSQNRTSLTPRSSTLQQTSSAWPSDSSWPARRS